MGDLREDEEKYRGHNDEDPSNDHDRFGTRVLPLPSKPEHGLASEIFVIPAEVALHDFLPLLDVLESRCWLRGQSCMSIGMTIRVSIHKSTVHTGFARSLETSHKRSR